MVREGWRSASLEDRHTLLEESLYRFTRITARDSDVLQRGFVADACVQCRAHGTAGQLLRIAQRQRRSFGQTFRIREHSSREAFGLDDLVGEAQSEALRSWNLAAFDAGLIGPLVAHGTHEVPCGATVGHK